MPWVADVGPPVVFVTVLLSGRARSDSPSDVSRPFSMFGRKAEDSKVNCASEATALP